MSTEKDRLDELDKAYKQLWNKHQELKREIQDNYSEVKQLQEKLGIAPVIPAITVESSVQSRPQASTSQNAVKEKSTWEQYIGEQLLSKIGIVILIIGVGIGGKYAIDKGIMGPAMRILCGYIVGGILGFFAWKFRKKYEAFSAVLVSGSMAVMYFITYAAYSFYGLIPYPLTFVLLLLVTAATVFMAIRYNMVIIAHIGLIGAYVLPALIANKPSHISNYLLYMSVINLGILIISFLRNWRSLYYLAFWWTMLVLVVWFFTRYDEKADVVIALSYAVGYFVLFHISAIAYKIRTKEKFDGEELILILPNVLVFLSIGSYILMEAGSGYNASFYFASALGFVIIGTSALLKKIRPEDDFLSVSHLILGVGVLLIALSAFSYGSGTVAGFLRYIDFFAIVGLLILMMRRKSESSGFVTLLHLFMIWALSVEITSLLTMMGSRKSYDLTLSIVWGIYSIYLLFTGINKKVTALRVTAMIIFGITLCKIFFFDLVKLDLLAKTVLLMVTGGIFLFAAYLYQKNRASNDSEENNPKQI